MGEAEGEENAEHWRNRDRIRFDLVDAGRRAVPWRFTRGPHRHTVNALSLGSEKRIEMVNGESALTATLSRRVPFNRSHELHRSQNARLSVDARLRQDLNCEVALITTVSVVTTLLRGTRVSS